MDADGRCADDGDAVQCLVLASVKDFDLIQGIRGRGTSVRWGGRGHLVR